VELVSAGPAGQDGGSNAADFLAAAGSPGGGAGGAGVCSCALGSLASKACASAVAQRCSPAAASAAFRDSDAICANAGYPGAAAVLKSNATALAALAGGLADACFPGLGAWGPQPEYVDPARARPPSALELGSDPCACFQSGLGSRDCTFARLSLCRASSPLCPALMLGAAAAAPSTALAARYAAEYCGAGVPALAELVAVAPGLTPERFQAVFAPMMAKGLAEAAGVDARAVRLAFHAGVPVGPAAPKPAAAAAAPAAAAAYAAAAPPPAKAAAAASADAAAAYDAPAPAAEAADADAPDYPAAAAAAPAPPPPPPPSSGSYGWGAAAPATSSGRRLRLRMLFQAAADPPATPQYTTADSPLYVSARVSGKGAAEALRLAAERGGGEALYGALAGAGFAFKPSVRLGDDASPLLKGEPIYARMGETVASTTAGKGPTASSAGGKGGGGGGGMVWWKALAVGLGVVLGTLALLGALFCCCLASKRRHSREIRARHEEQLAQSLRANEAKLGGGGSASPVGSASSTASADAKEAPSGRRAPRYSDDASFARDAKKVDAPVAAAPAAAATTANPLATTAALV
jgi:hypothetical protein